jgi:putative transposase
MEIEKIQLRAAIKHIHTEMDATYGSRRMVLELHEQGFHIGRYKVRHMMRTLGLVAKRPGKHRYPVVGKPSVIAGNIMNRQFNPENINTHWAGDITYLKTGQGWLYLAVVVELYSRRIVSYAFSPSPNSELTIRALAIAIEKRRPPTGLVFHSDQGCQYTSTHFQCYLQTHRIISSMSRRGNCLDNAVTERFFRSLKSERTTYRRYHTRKEAITDIIDYIESFYNHKRRHSKLGNISPVQYEQKMLKTA